MRQPAECPLGRNPFPVENKHEMFYNNVLNLAEYRRTRRGKNGIKAGDRRSARNRYCNRSWNVYN